MAKKLVDMEITEVSLVDKAANGRKFLIIKKAGEEETICKSCGGSVEEGKCLKCAAMVSKGDGEGGGLLSEIENLVKAGRKISSANLGRMKEIHGQLGGMIGEHENPTEKGEEDLTPEQKEKSAQLKKGVEDKMNEEIKKQLDAQDAIIKAQADTMALLQKSLDDQVAITKAAQDAVVTKEYVAKAAELKGLAVDPVAFGPVLKSLAEISPESFKVIESVLKAANEAIVKGALFVEQGRGGASTGDAYAKLEAAGVELRKSDSTLTKEQAFQKAAQMHPELYKAYRRGE